MTTARDKRDPTSRAGRRRLGLEAELNAFLWLEAAKRVQSPISLLYCFLVSMSAIQLSLLRLASLSSLCSAVSSAASLSLSSPRQSQSYLWP